MRFSVNYLSTFVEQLPKNFSLISKQLIDLGIEIEEVTFEGKEQDYIIDVALAPNRADLFSIIGIARELAAVNNVKLKLPKINTNINNEFNSDHIITVHDPKICPKYISRVISGINNNVQTPTWIVKALTDAKIKLVSPVVDLANYVMLEMGQPLHTFDLDRLKTDPIEIQIRTALANEELLLLNNNKIFLTEKDLIIADSEKPLALAGIMGGLDSAITKETNNVLIECAYFDPAHIKNSSSRHNILSDASQLFSKNIDPNLPDLAIYRYSNLLIEVTGGRLSDIKIKHYNKYVPIIAKIHLYREKINRILGFVPTEQKIIGILNNIGMQVNNVIDGWEVIVPSWRQDLTIQEDLIEEIARFIGYNNVIKQKISLPLITKMPTSGLNFSKELQYKNCLVNRGYKEIITYSFIDLDLALKFYPKLMHYKLRNPISKNMNVMRTGLLPGLFTTLIYNYNRQQERIRLFELGKVFIFKTESNDSIIENKKIAGLVLGLLLEENWQHNNKTNFFNLKSDIIALLLQNYNILANQIEFRSINDSYCSSDVFNFAHSANIFIDQRVVGVIGELNTKLTKEYSITEQVLMFELDLDCFDSISLPKFTGISKFPSIRRDFSVILETSTSFEEIKKIINNTCGELLKKIILFDIYSGNKLPEGKKSIAFGIILQSMEHTLVDQEINSIVSEIIINLENIKVYLRI